MSPNLTEPATLATPLTLPCGQILPNRIMKSALSEGLADEGGVPGDRIDRLYSSWSDGGYGLIVTGNVMVDGRYLGEPGNVILENDEQIDEFRSWAKNAQNGGSPVWVQVNHPGRQANPLTTTGRTVAPSAVGLDIPGMPAPRALTEDEIGDIVARFAATAELVELAGFDGVQIHAAHGYLISQFLSPLSNLRTDRWGGDIENRARILFDIIAAIRTAARPAFGVGVKINSADFQRGGFTEHESRAVITRLAEAGVDLIEISGGSYESPAMMGRPVASNSSSQREAYFLDYTRTVRDLVGDIPLAVTGGFRTRTGMSEALASDTCDVVGVGRPAAIAPQLAQSLLDDSTDTLERRAVKLPVPRRLAQVSTVKSLEGLLDLQWHTDQLHELGAGRTPDVSRPTWRTLATIVQRNGLGALKPTHRRVTASSSKRGARKFAVERLVGKYIANPTVLALNRIGLSTSYATDLSTTGRRSGTERVVPVAASFDQTGAWIISQHGLKAGWARNISADPRVRIRQGQRWRSGIAEFRPEDDVSTRAAGFATSRLAAPLIVSGFRALQTDPISVRITFTE